MRLQEEYLVSGIEREVCVSSLAVHHLYAFIAVLHIEKTG